MYQPLVLKLYTAQVSSALRILVINFINFSFWEVRNYLKINHFTLIKNLHSIINFIDIQIHNTNTSKFWITVIKKNNNNLHYWEFSLCIHHG